MVKRACLFEGPKTTPTTTSTTMTTAYRKAKAEVKAKDKVEKEVDHVLVEPVVVEAAYPNLVSIFSKNEFISNIQLKWLEIYLWSLN